MLTRGEWGRVCQHVLLYQTLAALDLASTQHLAHESVIRRIPHICQQSGPEDAAQKSLHIHSRVSQVLLTNMSASNSRRLSLSRNVSCCRTFWPRACATLIPRPHQNVSHLFAESKSAFMIRSQCKNTVPELPISEALRLVENNQIAPCSPFYLPFQGERHLLDATKCLSTLCAMLCLDDMLKRFMVTLSTTIFSKDHSDSSQAYAHSQAIRSLPDSLQPRCISASPSLCLPPSPPSRQLLKVPAAVVAVAATAAAVIAISIEMLVPQATRRKRTTLPRTGSL